MGTNHKRDLPLRDPKTGRFVGTKSSPMPRINDSELDCRDEGTSEKFDSSTQVNYEIWARERDRAEELTRIRREEKALQRAVWRAILIVLTLFAITLGVLATTRSARADDLYTMTHLRQLEQCQLMMVAHDTIRTVTDQAALEPTQVKPISDMFRLFKSRPSEAKKLQDFLTRLTCEEILIMTRTIQ